MTVHNIMHHAPSLVSRTPDELNMIIIYYTMAVHSPIYSLSILLAHPLYSNSQPSSPLAIFTGNKAEKWDDVIKYGDLTHMIQVINQHSTSLITSILLSRFKCQWYHHTQLGFSIKIVVCKLQIWSWLWITNCGYKTIVSSKIIIASSYNALQV